MATFEDFNFKLIVVEQHGLGRRRGAVHGLSPEPFKTDPAKLLELCPSLSSVASLSWFGFASSLSAS
ncbi:MULTISPECIES: hypothetical protein [unclassified Streptomyces]|uniref:hypothetical protein n=1 Tax=unclassified Streptomyces TaxID=2593676 RepID=UPI003078581F